MVFDKVKEIISRELNIDSSKVTPEAHLEKDLGADSLDAVEVIMALEDEFDIVPAVLDAYHQLEDEFDMSVDDDALQTIKTVQDLVEYIEAHK